MDKLEAFQLKMREKNLRGLWEAMHGGSEERSDYLPTPYPLEGRGAG